MMNSYEECLEWKALRGQLDTKFDEYLEWRMVREQLDAEFDEYMNELYSISNMPLISEDPLDFSIEGYGG